MRLHLVVLNGNCHTPDHISKVSTSFCNIFDSPRLFTSRYIFVSSANSFVVLVKTLVRSLKYITNSSGPSTTLWNATYYIFPRNVFCCLKMIVSTTVCHLSFPRHLPLRLVSYVAQNQTISYILCIYYVNSSALFYYACQSFDCQ